MARALAASRLYGDCVRYYYQYQTRGGAQWDTDQTLERRLPRIADEREALAVIRAIDRKKKEYQ
jgi:hypothetical protein